MTRIVIALFALLLFGQLTFAQCGAHYCPPVYRQPVYIAPQKEVIIKEVVREVVAPIAVPVVVPATVFQYMPALAPAAVPVAAAAPAAVAAQAAVPVQRQAAAAPVAAGATASADIDVLVRARVDAILRERLAKTDNDGEPPTLLLPAELQEPLKAPKEQAPKEQAAPQAAANGDLNQQVASLLGGQSCVNCHTESNGTPVKGNVTLFTKQNEQLFFQPSVTREKIVAALTPDHTGKPAMPPNGSPQSAANLDLLRRWVAQR